MKDYIKHHPWQIIEDGFSNDINRVSESIFSIGNGKFGLRGNFEETFSGDTLPGNYIAGVYYPDKTRVGWWKNGYPPYFAKVLNAPNWTKLTIKINGEKLDLARTKVNAFKRILDMKSGTLKRTFSVQLKNGINVTATTERFCSIDQDNLGVLSYKLTTDQPAKIELTSTIDGKIRNEDANYDNFFWKGVHSQADDDKCMIITRTKKTKFHVGLITETTIRVNSEDNVQFQSRKNTRNRASTTTSFLIQPNSSVNIVKKAVILSSLDVDKIKIKEELEATIKSLSTLGYEDLLLKQQQAWAKKWDESDIIIEGDIEAQQAIRFNIFQLNCTYTGSDERLNIGPKGFTGEKYGGSTYLLSDEFSTK